MARISTKRNLPFQRTTVPSSQKVSVSITDPLLLLKDTIDNQERTIAKIENHFGFYNNIVIGVFLLGFLVLLFTVAGLIIQSWQFNTTYQKESAQLKIQEALIKNTTDLQLEQNNLQKAILQKLNK